MRTGLLTAAATILLLGLASMAAAEDNGRIYGTIYTVDGDSFEGLIRWDKNEAHWVDILNGTKELKSRYRDRSSDRRRYRERKKSFKIFGVKIGESDNSWCWTGAAESGMRFGHIRTMEIIDDDRVLLTMKSGDEVELSDGSVWAAYIHTGGHRTEDAKTGTLWSIRLRVRPDHDGIELLPAPGA